MIEISSDLQILVVSADLDVHTNIKSVLNKVGLAHIDSIESGIDALKACNSKHYELIVCDQNTKYLSGWLLIQELKSAADIPNMAIVFVGKNHPPAPDESLKNYGISAFLSLPVNSKILMETISATLFDTYSKTTLESKYTEAKDSLINKLPEKALEHYIGLFNKTNKHVRSGIGIVQSYELSGNQEMADCYSQTLEQLEDVLPTGLMVSLRYSYKNNDFERAKKLTDQILLITSDTPLYFLSTLALADHNSRFDIMETIAKAAIKNNHSSVDFLIALAKVCFSLNQIEKSLENLLQAEKKYGKCLAGLNLQGICYRKLEKYSDAKRCYQSALKLSPMDVKIIFNLALTEISMNNLERAEHNLNLCLKISPSFEKASAKLQELATFSKH